MRRFRLLAGLMVFLVACVFTIITPQSATAALTYSSQVIADAPSVYWRLGEPAGTTSTVADSSGNNRTGTINWSTPTFGLPGAVAGDANTSADVWGTIFEPTTYAAPNTFTAEVWVNTTSTTGGSLLQFMDSGATVVDRAIWLDSSGHAVFAAYPGTAKEVTSSASYNDGNWHMIAVTMSSGGTTLYVDGTAVANDATLTSGYGFTGSWHLGDYPSNGYANPPSTSYLSGSEDEAALWNGTALTSTQIRVHYALGGGHGITKVSTTVDPSFSFSVGNQSTACNGESNFVASAGTATAIALGHVGAGGNVSGGQTLGVTANAGNGFAVYVRGLIGGGNFKNAGHAWVDVSSTYASPAALGAGEQFGFTYKDSTSPSNVSNPGSALFAPLTWTGGSKVMGSGSATSGSACVSFDAKAGSATPAGSYSGTVIYTAVPAF